MTKISNRKLFNFPKHEHYGTGIASGLGSRPGYRMGGQVKPKRGIVDGPGGYAGVGPNAVLSPSLDLNKILDESQTMGKEFTIDPRDLSVFKPEKIAPIDFSKYQTDATKYVTDYSKAQPTAMDAIGKTAADTIEELQYTPGGTLGKKSTVATFAKNFQRNAADVKTRRQELDLLSQKEIKQAEKLNDDQRIALQIKSDEDSRNISLLNTKQQNEFIKMEMDEIRSSDIANKEIILNLYKTNVETKLKEFKKDDKIFNIDRTMQIIDENTKSGVNFKNLPKESQDEVLRFNRIDEIQNNEMTKAIKVYNDKYMEDYSMNPENPFLNETQLEQKRKGLVQYMNSSYPSFDFNLIFRPPENTAVDRVLNAFEAYFPGISEQDKKIIEDNKTDVAFDKYITLLDKQQDGDTSVKLNDGGVVPIQDAIDQAITEIQMRYPSLNLGE